MNTTNNNTFGGAKGTSTLVRAKFGPGMLLQHDDLEQLNSYTRELSRLMFQSLFGCGVICGLVVEVVNDPKCGTVSITVGVGLALTCSGDPVYVPKSQPFSLSGCEREIPDQLWVVLCRTVKSCAPRTAICADDDDKVSSECTRERDGFEIQVLGTRPPKCLCGCKEPEELREMATNDKEAEFPLLLDEDCKCVNPKLDCYADHYKGECGCHCADCANCGGECVLLARLDYKENTKEGGKWIADHRVRRFIRPVLMRDPQVEIEEAARKKSQDGQLGALALQAKEQSTTATPGRIFGPQAGVEKEMPSGLLTRDLRDEIDENVRKDAQLQAVLTRDLQGEIEPSARKEVPDTPPEIPASQARKRSTPAKAKMHIKASLKQPKSGQSSSA